jgi:hypothetical protein
VKAGVNKYYYIFSYGSSEHLQNINNIYKWLNIMQKYLSCEKKKKNTI